jgi:DNA-binding CsgD family transcriptional regulator
MEGGQLVAADNGLFTCGAINCLAMADREAAMAGWDECLADAHRRGSLFSVSSVHLWRGHTYVLRGDIDDAIAELETAAAEFELYGYGAQAMTYVAAFLAIARQERGDLDGAWAAAALGGGAQDDLADAVRYWRHARLMLLLAEGRDAEALDAADGLAPRQEGWQNPLMHRWRSGKAVALARLGRAEEGLPLLREELAIARRNGAPGTLGPTLRVFGEVTGDVPLLEEAVTVLDGSTARLEWAKALLALGLATESEPALQRAHALATGCGAAPVADAARQALRGAVAPGGADALGGMERRVAAMAAEGRGDRDIAQALFLTPREVERHLASVAAKLGSGSRRDLAAALARS